LLADAIGSSPRGTQTRLAAALGVTVQTVNKWRQGQNMPEPERWSEIEVLLELPAGALARAAGIRSTQPTDDIVAEIRAIHVELRRLGDAFEQLAGKPLARPQSVPPRSRPAPHAAPQAVRSTPRGKDQRP